MISMPQSYDYSHIQPHSMQPHSKHPVPDYKHCLSIHKSSLKNESNDLYPNQNEIIMYSESQMKIMITAMITYYLHKIMIHFVATLYAAFVSMISLHWSYQFDKPLDQTVKDLLIRALNFEV